MPNNLDASGLTLATQDELITFLQAAYKSIYGDDINLDPDSPDGQWMMTIVQVALDNEDLMMQIYNSFDPDNAIGNVLDQRVAINGIQRQAGTHTVTNVTLVVTQALNLYGLDQDVFDPYTVADNQGNRWILMVSVVISTPGTYIYAFQAENPGAILTVPNTITVPVTIVLGVSSINNPTTYTTLGLNEESDAELKIRRQKSVSLSSQGYLAGLLAALENISGIVSAFVYENNTGSTDSDGIPGHSIWVIVSGSAANAAIANAIYTKRNAGCGMKGDVTYNISQVDGTLFTVRWDVVTPENLFIVFTATSLDGVNPPNIAAIKSGLVTSFAPGVNQQVNINELATLVQDIDSNTLVTNSGFSDGLSQTLNLSGVPASGTFKVNYNGNASAAINWNDNTATIQSKIRAITGLSAITVTGTLAGQQLVVNMSSVISAQTLLTITNNSLQTSAPASISITNNYDPQAILSPTTKANQFAVSANNIIVLPILISPSSNSVGTAHTINFSALGGYESYTWSITVNNSGGSINASTGVYTSGGTPGTDTVRVTDALGNFTNINVVVT